jgi:putative ATP-binding cassette transporter
VNNIRSTLATVWRIAAPYFRSEDKWAGRGLLAAVISIELSLVAIDVLLNQWNNRFLQRASGEELGRLRQGNRLFCVWRRATSRLPSTSSISINGCRSAGGAG